MGFRVVGKGEGTPSAAEVRKLIERANKRVADNTARSFRRTWATWNHKPKTKVTPLPKKAGFKVEVVGEHADIFRWVSRGTGKYGKRGKPYPIPKPSNKTAKTLRFQSNYTAKTRPGFIEARGGGASGAWRSAKLVMHPGIKPRKFEEQIAEKADERWANAIQTELDKLK